MNQPVNQPLNHTMLLLFMTNGLSRDGTSCKRESPQTKFLVCCELRGRKIEATKTINNGMLRLLNCMR
jgi:hypothetical protein